MSVQIIIHGETASDALVQLRTLAGVANATTPSPNKSAPPVHKLEHGEPASEGRIGADAEIRQEKPKRKRGRPSKAEKEAAEAKVAEAEQSDTAEAEQEQDDVSDLLGNDEDGTPESYTVDDVRAAVQRHAAKHGLAKTHDLLIKYGAAKVTELHVEHYADLIGECPA